jgi:hypothetical protein
MYRVRSLLFAVLAVSALGSFAASSALAATSTSVLLLPGDSFPVKFSSLPKDQPNNGIKSELQSAADTLDGEGLLLQGEILTATGGLYEALFLKVTLRVSKTECESEPKESALGEVLVPRGNFTVVHDISSTSGVGVLFEVKEFTIVCGLTKHKIKGSMLGLLTPVGTEILWLGLNLSLHCNGVTVGEPAETKYWTSLLSSELTALLLMNSGTGLKKACVEIVPTTVAIDVSKMITLMQ